jgi:hypothetical protein
MPDASMALMLSALSRIPATWFESLGTVAAGLAWLAISAQMYQELSRTGPSSLALLNLFGFLLNFAFWTLYGLRFDRPAVWIGNIIGVILQSTLIAIVLCKGMHS